MSLFHFKSFDPILVLLAGLCFLLIPLTASATEFSPASETLLKQLEVEAKKEVPGLKAFSAEEGKKLYFAKRTHVKKNEVRGCTTCHRDDPKQAGETPVGKPIDPLAPAAGNKRFTKLEKIEKWFKRNCKWVLERECTAVEKGHFLTYIFSVQ